MANPIRLSFALAALALLTAGLALAHKPYTGPETEGER